MTEERKKYLVELADEYGVDYDYVITLAYALGPNEDRDGLVSMIQDFVEIF